MNDKVIRVVAAVVDTRNLTLYKEDGTTVLIPQGDIRLRRIVEAAAPDLVRQGWSDVDISAPIDTTYADFEKESSGAVKFFRIAKLKLKSLFNPEPPIVVQLIDPNPVLPLSIGLVPVQPIPAPAAQVMTAADHLAAAQADADAIMLLPTVIVPTPAVQATATQLQADADPVDVQDEEEQEEVIQHEPSEPVVKHTMAVVNEILSHAIPVASPDFHEDGVAKQGKVVEENGNTHKDHGDETKEDTIIAVVDGKIIPGMERIKTQFDRAAKLGSTAGVEKFLQRLASVIEQRSHSVEDLLKFMERGDLPIADDGSILIYKVLAKSDGKYVDCHSKKVEQFVGAYVCMDPKLVDHDRNNECSNGLHVARRGYLGGFSGDVCVLAKLAPEDVITVPSYDANKMRVCGYHIIKELSSDQFAQLKSNKPLTNNEAGQRLLGQMLAGQHIRRTHEVRITGSMGNGVITTEIVAEAKPAAAAPTMADVPTKLISDAADAIEEFGDDELERYADEQRKLERKPVLVEALENPETEQGDKPTDPLEVVKTVEQLSKKDQAARLYAAWDNAPQSEVAEALSKLLAFKKAAKKGWDHLGIPDPTEKKVKTPKLFDKKPNPPPKLWPEVKVKTVAPKVKRTPQVHDVDFGNEPKDRTGGVDDNDDVANLSASSEDVVKATPRERIQKLLAIGITSAGIAQAILTIKKQSKKSWTVLGVSDEQVDAILKLAGAG